MSRQIWDQRGDTLVEVVMGLAILGLTLVSVYSLSDKAFQAAMTARERSQLVLAAQSQAEALTNMRDSQPWSAFVAGLSAHLDSAGRVHLAKQTVAAAQQWRPATGVATDNTYLPPGNEVWIDAPATELTSTSRLIHFQIHYQALAIGGGTNSSVIYLQLANLDGLRQ